MAGVDPSFDANFFRAQIQAVMQMGLPSATSDRPTFRWVTTHTYAPGDPVNQPYNWGQGPVTTTAHADVQVNCVVQFAERSPEGSAMGSFDASKAIITILDNDYALVKGANQVLLGGRTFDIVVVGPPEGLFNVTIYSLYCIARDQ
jgi:hypothetical protein